MHGLIMKNASEVVQQAMAENARSEAMRNALRVGTAGLGLGIGGRSLYGLINQWRRSFQPTRVSRKPSVVNIPVASDEPEEKLAAAPGMSELMTDPAGTVKSWFAGDYARNAREVPFGMVPSMLLGAGGVGLGWAGMDKLMDKRREAELKTKEERARQEYEEALNAQSKIGQAIHAELDSLFDKLSEDRREVLIKTAADLGADMSNLYGMWALVSGVPAAVWAYEHTKARQRSSVLEKARKQHQRDLEHVRPTPVFAQPAPINKGNTLKSAPDAEELEGSPLDKAAGCGLILAFAR